MKTIPIDLIRSLNAVEGFDKDAFLRVHETRNAPTSIRINPLKCSPHELAENFSKQLPQDHSSIHLEKIPWTENAFYLSSRPSFTFDPFFHAGCYYVQEASSMFLEQAFRQLIDLSVPLTVLDLCGAPGGKSTHIQSLLSQESVLVSNELISSRASVLKDNLIKWGSTNTIVTQTDPSGFADLKSLFDVIVVDAPCSGSGLFRRDPEAIDEWSTAAVKSCSIRQRKILTEIIPALKENGVLIYSTCSFSVEEDEGIVDWLLESGELVSMPVSVKKEWNIVETRSQIRKGSGYRFFPDKLQGEGFFLACFKKEAASVPQQRIAKTKLTQLLKESEEKIVKEFMEIGGFALLKNAHNKVTAATDATLGLLPQLQNHLKIRYLGLEVGELIRDELIPDHALAMSLKIADEVQSVELDYKNAIKFLQRKEFDADLSVLGWNLVKFQGHSLGWIKAMKGRINNYYPKELRILKDSPHSNLGK